jgi:hypothetical protein
VDEPPVEVCDQDLDPLCLKRLSAEDRSKLQTVLNNRMRNNTEITDPVARERCGNLSAALEYVLQTDASTPDAQAILHIGRTNSAHLGQGEVAAGGKAHIDPRIFAAATTPTGESMLLRAALHELAHSYFGYAHPVATNGTTTGNLPPNYEQDPFFREVHSTDNSIACIRW